MNLIVAVDKKVTSGKAHRLELILDTPDIHANGNDLALFTCRVLDSNGNEVKGYYLYPADAINYLTKDGAQWNYGYKDGYFESIIAKIKSIDENKLSDLVANVEKAKTLADAAFSVELR